MPSVANAIRLRAARLAAEANQRVEAARLYLEASRRAAASGDDAAEFAGFRASWIELPWVSRRLPKEDDLSSGEETLHGCPDHGSTQRS
jgi:hypothetical protein